MKSKLEINRTNITINNSPKLSEHEVDKVFNERRLSLVPVVENYLSNHKLFAGKEVGVTFSQAGVSSLVVIIEIPEGKYVLKIPLSLTHSQGEGLFLKIWEGAGVKTPHVIEEGNINEYSFALMEFINAETLDSVKSGSELIQSETFVKMGSILRKMHEPEAPGYGRYLDGKPEFLTFKDWFEGEDVQKKISYVQEHNLLDEECGSISEAVKILLGYVDGNKRSSYCHDDFGTSNIFATEPLTVFDPNPRFNNAYLDLAKSLVINMSNKNLTGSDEQMIRGYFGDEPYDKKVLQAAIILNACFKFPYWSKTKKIGRINQVKDYLIKTRYNLDKN